MKGLRCLAVVMFVVSMCSYGMDHAGERNPLLPIPDGDGYGAAQTACDGEVREFVLDMGGAGSDSDGEDAPDCVVSRLARAAGAQEIALSDVGHRLTVRLAVLRDRHKADDYRHFVREELREFGLRSAHRGHAGAGQPDILAIFERVLESKEKELDALHRENQMRIELERVSRDERDRADRLERELQQLRDELARGAAIAGGTGGDAAPGQGRLGVIQRNPGRTLTMGLATLLITNGAQLLERFLAK